MAVAAGAVRVSCRWCARRQPRLTQAPRNPVEDDAEVVVAGLVGGGGGGLTPLVFARAKAI